MQRSTPWKPTSVVISPVYKHLFGHLFALDFTGSSSFEFKIYVPERYSMIKSVFYDIFGGILGDTDINLVTASLFFSMLPLHSDSSLRMLALSFVGSSIINHPTPSGLHFSFK